LVVTSYSKHNSVEKITKALKDAPQQKCNTPEAMAGKVFEMRYNGKGPVGTLSEYFIHGNIASALIMVEDGSVMVERQENGEWVAVDTKKG